MAGRRAAGRTGGRAGALWLATATFAAGAASPLAAQVGHPPGASPYRDVLTRQSVTVGVGRFYGNAAVAGVGWRAGTMLAGRFDTRLTSALDFSVGLAFPASNRFRIDTQKDSASRVTGPVDHTLMLADLGITLNLTGAKSWRGIAPYAGFGIGYMLPMKGETDPGGYNAGANFTLVPTFGTRVFFGRRLAARVEVRDYYWRYEWPARYYAPLDANSNAISPPILAEDVKSRQWAHNVTLTIGLAYGFNF